MKVIKAFAIGAVLAAGVASAQEKPTDPNAVARAEWDLELKVPVGMAPVAPEEGGRPTIN